MDEYEFTNENTAKKKVHIIRKLIIVFSVLAIIVLVITGTIHIIKNHNSKHISSKTLSRYWNENDSSKYQKIYEDGKILLQKEPFNNTALVYYGYACFYLAVSQTDSAQIQMYLDECIISLRQA